MIFNTKQSFTEVKFQIFFEILSVILRFYLKSRQELQHQKSQNDNSKLLQQATTNFWNGVICYDIYKIDKISQKQTFMPPSTCNYTFYKQIFFILSIKCLNFLLNGQMRVQTDPQQVQVTFYEMNPLFLPLNQNVTTDCHGFTFFVI